MIVSVSYKPTWLSPAYNPIIWSALSSKISSIDFKYVFDIYIDGIFINRIKQRANPAGYGMIDVSTIMQGYLETNNMAAPITQGETSIDWNNGKLFQDNQYLSKHVNIKVGEEYTTPATSGAAAGTFIYNGVADVIGDPAYVLNSGNTSNTSLSVRTWSASMEDQAQQWSMQKTTASGIFGGNPFDSNKVYDHGIGLANPLKLGSNTENVYEFDKKVISFLNWSPYPSQQARPIYGFKYKVYNASGALVQTFDRPLITQYGYGQRATASSTVSSELESRYDIVHVLASPQDVMTACDPTGVLVPNFGPGYSIHITGHAGANGTLTTQITKTQIVNVIEYCNPLYERVRLSWFNELGGRDYLNFTMFDEKTINTSADSYAQEQMNWSGSTPVQLLNNSDVIKNLGVRGGNKVYNKQATTTHKIQTDWLTQEEMNLLEGLQKSPQVLAYIHSQTNTLSDDYAYTCTVKNSSYSVKNIKQTKLYQGSFDLEIAMQQKLQNL